MSSYVQNNQSQRIKSWATILLYSRGDKLVCIKFHNDKIVNPPGVIYIDKETKIKLLSPLKKKRWTDWNEEQKSA